ncbi:BolA family protein [Roseibium algae]|uniref:BolA family protein n=1 Tax=Roseibium algae TaxID=3123038 RepID=A0ABU8TNX0_9HYPH
MSMQETITIKLTRAFAPASLDIIDESDKHKGHGGWREGGETHFRVRIVAEAFSGMSRVARHRAINDALATELATTVHALAIEVRAPEDTDPRAARQHGTS